MARKDLGDDLLSKTIYLAGVNTASVAMNYNFSVEVINHLTGILSRFYKHPEYYFGSSALKNNALDFKFEATSKKELVTLGEKSLLTAGMFPQFLKRKPVDSDDLINVAQKAFSQYARLADQPEKRMFEELACNARNIVELFSMLSGAVDPEDIHEWSDCSPKEDESVPGDDVSGEWLTMLPREFDNN